VVEVRGRSKVVIAYDSMWGMTARMAHLISMGAQDSGAIVRLYDIKTTPRSTILSDILDAAVIIIGSPTLNNEIYPNVAGILTYIRGLRPKKKKATAFGSFGWVGGAVKNILAEFKAMGLETIEPGLEFKFHLSPEDEKECLDLGRRAGKLALEAGK
jgi:anaerobic nitric oxide reductase flavorubredoxin